MNGSTSTPLLPLVNPWGIAANLWRHRDLIWQFTLREIHIRHKGSRLGILWTLINPLTMLGLYYFIFGVVYKNTFGVLPEETRLDFALALFLGLSLFHVFAETLGWVMFQTGDDETDHPRLRSPAPPVVRDLPGDRNDRVVQTSFLEAGRLAASGTIADRLRPLVTRPSRLGH